MVVLTCNPCTLEAEPGGLPGVRKPARSYIAKSFLKIKTPTLKHRRICTLIHTAMPFITLSSRANVGIHTRGTDKEDGLCVHNGFFF